MFIADFLLVPGNLWLHASTQVHAEWCAGEDESVQSHLAAL